MSRRPSNRRLHPTAPVRVSRYALGLRESSSTGFQEVLAR